MTTTTTTTTTTAVAVTTRNDFPHSHHFGSGLRTLPKFSFEIFSLWRLPPTLSSLLPSSRWIFETPWPRPSSNSSRVVPLRSCRRNLATEVPPIKFRILDSFVAKVFEGPRPCSLPAAGYSCHIRDRRPRGFVIIRTPSSSTPPSLSSSHKVINFIYK